MVQVSVIVPVFNAADKLLRCIDALLRQQDCSFEVILIDDGSKDNSGIICDCIAQKNKRVRVFHQGNKGAAAARNVGIKAACGEYVAFCDADDVVSDQWLARMLQYAEDAVLPIGNYCTHFESLKTQKNLEFEVAKKYPLEKYWDFQQCGIAGYLCNALYSRKVIIENDLFIPERKALNDINEDLTFALSYVTNVKYIAYTGFMDYFYDTHEGSLSRSNRKMYFTKYEEKYKLWRTFVEENCKNVELQYKCLADNYLYHFLTALQYAVDENDYEQFERIVLSTVVDHCLLYADTSSENGVVIKLLLNKQVFRLWLFFKLVQVKKKFTKKPTLLI